MQRRFQQQLPKDLQQLVDRIEDHAKREIGVEVNPEPEAIDTPNPGYLAVHITECEATIRVRHLDILPPDGITHELLHIHRFWVEGAPQFRIEWPHEHVGTVVDNALEHLVIVPRQSRYPWFDAQKWARTMQHNWTRYESLTVDTDRRIHGLLGWVTSVYLGNDRDVIAYGEEKLRAAQVLEDARQFERDLGDALPMKETMVEVTLRHLRLPALGFSLAYLDAKAGLRREVPL